MKIHEYNEMMAYLTRPTVNRVGFADGTKNRPKISNVNFKQIISDSFEKIFNQKGKVSISDIVSDTGYSKPTIYKYLSESQSVQLIGQPTPVTNKITKEVNQIIDDVFKNKKALINASPNRIYTKVTGKDPKNIKVVQKILNENPNWPKIREAVINTSARVGAGNKIFETVKFKDFDKALAKAMKSRSLTRAGTVEEFMLRDLKRHVDQGGTKFSFAKGNSLEKGFKGLKIKDLTKGDIITFDSIKKGIANNDSRFKEYKKVFNNIKKLKLTPYINPISQEKTTLLKGLQEATGIDAPLHIQHAKGVAVDPLKNLSIATHKANIGAKMVGSVEDVATLGVRSTVSGGKKVYGPKLSFKDEVNRLTKFSDRMIKGAGTRTLKTPTETLKLKAFNIGKTVAKPIVRAVAPFVPFLGPIGVGLGAADVAEASEFTKKPDELGLAYLAGPDLARSYGEYKDRIRGMQDETEEFVP